MAIVVSSIPHRWRTHFEGLFEVSVVAFGAHHLVHKLEGRPVVSSTPLHLRTRPEVLLFVKLLVMFVGLVLEHGGLRDVIGPLTC